MKEIGSEFWDITEELKDKKYTDNINKYLQKLGSDRQILFSGRTALDFVIKDILLEKEIKTAYLPSYCCDSMIEPFKKNSINIAFYDVNYDDRLSYNIDENIDCDIFYAMNYFGFNESNMDEYIEKFKNKNAIIIEDSTQCLLNNRINNCLSDYTIISLRKWFPIIDGGIAIKKEGVLRNKEKLKIGNDKIIKLKKEAMVEKTKYIMGINTDKDIFLRKYKESNEELKNLDYSYLLIDDESKDILNKISINYVRKQRQKNTEYIYNELRNDNIKFVFSNQDKKNVPLYVPVVLDNSQIRDKLSEYLIDNQVYCPIHWPKPADSMNSNLYNIELSLVCDQRYSIEDIKREIALLNSFYLN